MRAFGVPIRQSAPSRVRVCVRGCATARDGGGRNAASASHAIYACAVSRPPCAILLPHHGRSCLTRMSRGGNNAVFGGWWPKSCQVARCVSTRPASGFEMHTCLTRACTTETGIAPVLADSAWRFAKVWRAGRAAQCGLRDIRPRSCGDRRTRPVLPRGALWIRAW